MKVLILDGTKKERMSPVLLYLAQKYNTRVISAVSPDLEVLCQKYDTWDNIPDKEIMSTMEATILHVCNVIKDYEPDIVVGLEYGASVLSNICADYYWEGESVYLDPRGYFFASRDRFTDECSLGEKSYWILRKTCKSPSRKHMEKLNHFKRGTVVLLNDKDGIETAIHSGILYGIIDRMAK